MAILLHGNGRRLCVVGGGTLLSNNMRKIRWPVQMQHWKEKSLRNYTVSQMVSPIQFCTRQLVMRKSVSRGVRTDASRKPTRAFRCIPPRAEEAGDVFSIQPSAPDHQSRTAPFCACPLLPQRSPRAFLGSSQSQTVLLFVVEDEDGPWCSQRVGLHGGEQASALNSGEWAGGSLPAPDHNSPKAFHQPRGCVAAGIICMFVCPRLGAADNKVQKG